MIGGVFFRFGGAVVLGVVGAGGGLFDCASFMDRGLNVRSFDRLRMSGGALASGSGGLILP